jgi:S-methylmethionine-dependent homocysteine/selenocysteine methylase
MRHGCGITGHDSAAASVVVCFETIPAPAEAILLARFMAAEHPTVPYWIAMQCKSRDDCAAPRAGSGGYNGEAVVDAAHVSGGESGAARAAVPHSGVDNGVAGTAVTADGSSLGEGCTAIVSAAVGSRLLGLGANCFSPAIALSVIGTIRAAVPAVS